MIHFELFLPPSPLHPQWYAGAISTPNYQILDKAAEKKKLWGHSSKESLSTVRLLCFFTNLRQAGR